jgi:hypothetical protein
VPTVLVVCALVEALGVCGLLEGLRVCGLLEALTVPLPLPARAATGILHFSLSPAPPPVAP